MVRLADCPDMTLAVYSGCKSTTRVATVREKYLENENFSRSGKRQGI